ncbi:hypothetical protein ABTM35_19825, partial [Acinetobacter baumannii]
MTITTTLNNAAVNNMVYTDYDGGGSTFTSFNSGDDINLRGFTISGKLTTTVDIGRTAANKADAEVSVGLTNPLSVSFTTSSG